MKQRTKKILTLTLTLLAGIVVYFAFIRKVPSASHLGHYAEKHIWSESPNVYGGEETTKESLEVWDRYQISNPTGHSIWISAYDRGSGWQPVTEIRLSPVRPPHTDPPYPGEPPRDQWHFVSGGCGNGVRYREIEIPSGWTWTFLLGARTDPIHEDIQGARIPFRTSPFSHGDRKFQEFMDSMRSKLGLGRITIPLQPILNKHLVVVDRVDDGYRYQPPENSEAVAPGKE